MKQAQRENRITELDAARGIAILCVVAVHTFSFGKTFGGWNPEWIPFFWAVKQYGGAFFVFLSGVCVTLGHKSVRRGLTVFAFGVCLSAVTWWLVLSGRETEEALIHWGVLHCIGMCMILWPLFKKMPAWLRMVLAAAMIAAGYYLEFRVRVSSPWLFPLGLKTWDFTALDYFPLLPHLGWFLLGSGIGSLVYIDRRPLIPSLEPGVLAFCGRHSLAIYMIHQPLLYLIFRFGGIK